MLAVTLSSSSVSILEIEKNLMGKFVVKAGGKDDLQQDPQWEEKVHAAIKNKHTSFAIPDKDVYVYRFEVSNDIARDVLKSTIFSKVREIIPVSLDELIYDFTIFKDEESSHVLFIAASPQTLLPFYDISKKAGTRSLTIVPQSLAIFEILKQSISRDETILYADIGAQTTTLTFFDSHGPVMNLSEAIDTKKLGAEIVKAIIFFKEKYNKEVTTVVIGGEESKDILLEDLKKGTNISVIKADTFFNDTLIDLGIQFSPTDLKAESFINALGTGLLSFQKETINLAKKEKMHLIQQHVKKDSSQTDPIQYEEPPFIKTKTPSRFFNRKTLTILAACIILIPLIVFSYSLFKDSQNKEETTLAAKESQATPTPTPTPALVKSSLSLQVQNGSGETGAATKASDVLTKLGYTNIETKNAVSYTFKNATLRLKESKNEYKNLLLADLKEGFENVNDTEILDENSPFDAVIIIGKKE